MAKGLNLKSVKSENRSLILYLLNSNGNLSRKEIAAKLSLTPAGVTKICNELIDEGYIKEQGTVDAQGKSGRKEVLLSLCLSDKLVLGINAETDCITYSVSSLDGKLLHLKNIKFYKNIDNVVDNAVDFLYNLDIDVNKLVGIGVCVIGSVNQSGYSIWNAKELSTKLSNKFNLSVVVENNVKAFAQSELLYGSSKTKASSLFLKWGPGIGSAIVTNGTVYSGNDSGVAEIGHYIVNKGGKKCRCGRYGCLETEVASSVIINELNNGQNLNQIVNSTNNDVAYYLEHKIDLVALTLANTATILNMDNVVLFGSMFNDNIANKLIKQCIRYNSNLDDNMITLSSLNDKREYIGTTAICAKKFFFEQ